MAGWEKQGGVRRWFARAGFFLCNTALPYFYHSEVTVDFHLPSQKLLEPIVAIQKYSQQAHRPNPIVRGKKGSYLHRILFSRDDQVGSARLRPGPDHSYIRRGIGMVVGENHLVEDPCPLAFQRPPE